MIKWICYEVRTHPDGTKERHHIVGDVVYLYDDGIKISVAQVINYKIVSVFHKDNVVKLLIPTKGRF